MNFKIEKENEGQEYAFSDDSNAESEIHIRQKRKSKRKIVRKSKKLPSPESSVPSSPRSVNEQPMKNNFKRRPEPLRDDTYEMFSNPNKVMPDKPEDAEDFDGSENDNSSEGNPVSDEGGDYDDYDDDGEPKPSEGYKTIEEEKKDLIYKLFRLSSKGIPVSKKYNMHSDIEEMRSEYYRIERDIKVNSSIKFSRRMLMACVTGLEFLNKDLSLVCPTSH